MFHYILIGFTSLALFVSNSLIGMDLPKTPGAICRYNGQIAQVVEIFTPAKREVGLALCPLPGYKVPRSVDLRNRFSCPVDREAALRACATYCRNPLFGKLFTKLQQGELVRALLDGGPGVGKNFLAVAFPQESGFPYAIVSVPATRVGSIWLNSEYEGMKDILAQMTEFVRTSGKKAVLIINDIDVLGDFEDCICYVKPVTVGMKALHELFDKQDQEDADAKNISIIGLTSSPQKISQQITARFVDKIHVDLPDTTARHDIILSYLPRWKDKLDERVLAHIDDLAAMTDLLSAREIEEIFEKAEERSYTADESQSQITWGCLQEVCTMKVNGKKANLKPQGIMAFLTTFWRDIFSVGL